MDLGSIDNSINQFSSSANDNFSQSNEQESQVQSKLITNRFAEIWVSPFEYISLEADERNQKPQINENQFSGKFKLSHDGTSKR